MIEWHLETRKIKDLKDYSKNPRKMTEKQFNTLKQSVSKFGLIDKPFINLDNTIIGGHQRVRLLKKMGQKELEVQVPNRILEEKDVEELNILHNQKADWDWDMLANEFDVGDLLNWGFTVEQLQFDAVDQTDSSEQKKQKKSNLCPNCGYEI